MGGRSIDVNRAVACLASCSLTNDRYWVEQIKHTKARPAAKEKGCQLGSGTAKQFCAIRFNAGLQPDEGRTRTPKTTSAVRVAIPMLKLNP